ncbi:MAG TPA: hypothetical protein VFH72_08685 [Candidatus Baltobacteraceae bacterium]|nr:hypothetical protein [Candidatus Baltobacteraceae bacterium]
MPVATMRTSAFTDFAYDAHGFVPEDLAFFDAFHRTADEMQIGAANRARRNIDESILVVNDARFLDVVDADIARTMKNYCFHAQLVPSTSTVMLRHRSMAEVSRPSKKTSGAFAPLYRSHGASMPQPRFDTSA